MRRLIAAQSPRWAALPVRQVRPGGWDHRTFRLGEALSVRLPSAARYAGQVVKEHDWLPRLAPRLPLAVPLPLFLGAPGCGYPWSWSVPPWLAGQESRPERIADPRRFARTLARFLVALWGVDTAGGPLPGQHNFFRGGPVSVYGAETRAAVRTVRGLGLDTAPLLELWDAALRTRWRRAPVWVHGDVSAGNLLVEDGELAAVIDFGCLAVGDPACDLTIAWTLLPDDARGAFRAELAVDAETWTRARGWALWKALITLAEHHARDRERADQARAVIQRVLRDRAASS